MGTLCLHMGVGTYQSKGFFAYDQEENNVYRAGHDPGDGIGNIQIFRGAVHLEDGEDPDKADTAHAQHRDDHGHQGGSHAPQGAGGHIHQAAEEVHQADILHTDQAVLDSLGRIGNIDAKKLRAEGVHEAAQHQARHAYAGQAGPQDPLDPVILSGTHILTGEVHGSLVEGVHGGEDKALDITGGGIYGKPVYATRSGTVITAVNGYSGYGKYVIIDHGDGYQSLYGHCSSLTVSSGQKVSKGQMVARVGSSGNSTGPHLHFEIRKGGVKQNPMNYVRKP